MDNKYGRIFTEEDVKRLLQDDRYFVSGRPVEEILDEFEGKFPKNEPVFVLRGQDKRAIGALRYYRDHQDPRAPLSHLDSVDKAYDRFSDFRIHHETKEPD